MRKRLLVAVGIFISINSFASADEIKKDESTLNSIPYETACKKTKPIETKVPFPELQKLALTTSDVICVALLFDPDPSGDQVIKAIDKFFIDAAPIFEETFPDTWDLSDISLQKPSVFFQDVHRLAIGKDLTKRGRITVNVGDNDNESVRMDYLDSTKYLSVLSEPKEGEDRKNCAMTEEQADPNKIYCFNLADSYTHNFNLYLASINQKMTSDNALVIKDIRSSWDRYFEKSRSQTFIDTALTSWIYRKHYQTSNFVSPGTIQYFTLHPSIVYEHISDSERGSRDEVGFALEVFGMNWWDNKTLPPLGFSVAALYTDRASVKSTAPSLMIHIDNQYSLGFAFRSEKDGGDGIFFTMDLLKLLEDKKSGAQKYIDDLNQSF